jgi:hypothetical protein
VLKVVKRSPRGASPHLEQEELASVDGDLSGRPWVARRPPSTPPSSGHYPCPPTAADHWSLCSLNVITLRQLFSMLLV